MSNRFFAFFRGNIYVAMLLRLLLVYALFSLCRLAFYLYNIEFFPDLSAERLFRIFVGGLKFDTTAILYVNVLFIVGNTLPFKFRLLGGYQKVLLWFFVITNGIALISNIADIPYYAFTYRRTTWDVFAQFSHEQNILSLSFRFLLDYWYAVLFFVALLYVLIRIYKAIPFDSNPKIQNPIAYYLLNTVALLASITLFIGGVRGGFEHSTRPITLSNAAVYVENPSETVLVLNTPFSMLRTTDQSGLQKKKYFAEGELESIYSPVYKATANAPMRQMNVVILIMESFAKEYVGGLNKNSKIPNYTGYTPFLDSLIKESLVFEKGFANGKKSIEGLPSVLCGIPGMQSPYILTPYSNNTINSLPGLLAKEGYHSSFFHGAPNGSMGFDAFVNAAGIAHYYGKNEYNNDADYDGMWGIWDEPFFQYYAKKLNTFKPPFCSALFSISSHHPFEVPAAYEGKLKEGPHPINRCVHYSDIALRKFFKTASSMPWFKNTLFVITADHSFAPYYPEYQNGVDKYAVPIIFYTPNGSLKGYNDSIVAQQIDIMPTVLHYLKYPKPFLAFGKDLLKTTKEESFAINYLNDNYQFLVGDFLLLYDGKNINGLYNYKTDRSLSNQINNIELEQKLLKRAQAFIQQYNNRMLENRLIVK